MWTRKDVKQGARKNLRGNYWHAVAVCLIMAFLVGAYPTNHQIMAEDQALLGDRFRSLSHAGVLQELAEHVEHWPLVAWLDQQSHATQGVLANVINNVTASGSFVFGLLNAINKMVSGGGALPGIFVLLGTAVLFLYWLLVGNLLRIGECRFFLESRVYQGTRMNRLLYLYRLQRIKNPMKIMLLKTAKIALWSLTIVGGIRKFYAYRMVSFIVAENPDISAGEAFALSERMTQGQKLRIFLLDLSFLGWTALNYATLGFLGCLFLNPYKAATQAELYLRLREAVPSESLRDRWLQEIPVSYEGSAYPLHLYAIPEPENTAWMAADYRTPYHPMNLVLIFFAFCMVGWCWEVLLDLLSKGEFVNRGTLYGPWLPIYGTGGTAVVILFRRFAKRPPLTFALVVLFCGLLEFATSWVLERFTGQRWWDYSGYFFNIQGRVCLEGLLVFGLGGCLAIYGIAPALNGLFNRMPPRVRNAIGAGLLALFAADVAISAVHPNTAAASDAPKGD